MNAQNNHDKVLTEVEGRLKNLSYEKLLVANDFLSYLEEKESALATEELLNIPGFAKEFEIASMQAEQGELKNLDEIKRNV